MHGTHNVTLTHCNIMHGTHVTLTHCNIMHGTYVKKKLHTKLNFTHFVELAAIIYQIYSLKMTL